MTKNDIAAILRKSVVNPNDRKDRVLSSLVENATASYFEMRIIEIMGECQRLRERGNNETLREQYNLRMQEALTYGALALGKYNESTKPKGKHPSGSKNPRSDGDVPTGEGLGGQGDAR